jgi:hypothetical protein
MTMTASNSWLLAALLLAFPVAARADGTPPTPTPEQVEAAKAQYHEARELHRQGKIKEALEHALAAYRTAGTPVTALEAAQLLIENGQLVEGRDLARSVALFPPSPRESDKGREARQAAATLAASLDTRIPKIAIAGRPPGVDVVLDGKPFAGSDPTAWQGLDPGAHSLLVRAGERVCTTINVTLAEAEARTIDLHDVAVTCGLEPAPAPSIETPAAPPAAVPAATAPPPGPLEPTPSDGSARTYRVAGVALAGAGVVAIAVGGIVALAAKSSYDSVAGECPARGCTTAAFDVRESARSRGDAATVTMIAGAAVLTGGVLLFALAPDAPAGVRVGLGPGSARVVFSFE